MSKIKQRKPATRDPMARDLFTPKYRTRVVPSKLEKLAKEQGRGKKHKKIEW